ncbi:carbonic anhydrase [Massilia psychrophila]|uniref:Carbonic anhydrase 2 n=1 Tax=Massilia psychrophila TaxID=1603353 RepID=A0A2G8T3S8_9BURK|nr:carbonic anhydrase [Massilia psychrophila]PIL40691.1 carbonic anhydrase [Massilia psychrophila]GGE64100.1 carbonic anhydrase [Massilia psychrophila]
MIESYQKLLLQNKAWVKQKNLDDQDFFSDLSKIQKPDFFWIGCSDSRVPANEITGTDPGEIFVHRNIANMVVHTDMNMLSALDYAINVLEVKHVIVCGHYGCGGVRAALSKKQYGLIDNWIRHIKDVHHTHHDEIEAIDNPHEKEKRFIELNVVEQVNALSKTSIIQNAWRQRQSPFIHGWVYDLETGYIKDLQISLNDSSSIPAVYQFDAHSPQA